MRTAAALLALLAIGCSQAAVPVAHSATPSPSQLAGPSPTPSESTPTDLPLTVVGFSCRLPIMTTDGKGAFVSFPAGAISLDPNSPPMVGSAWGLYYDRALSRWLPVARQAVSPDGKHFAYGERGADQTKVARMHVVDIATGSDHVFATPSTDWFIPYAVLDYASEGIYLYTNYEASIGVWLMNPTTGSIHKVANLLDVQATGGNRTFWVGSVNPADPHPVGGLGILPNQIDRFNLVDGTRVAWFYRPGSELRVIGSDTQGHPIVLLVNGQNGVIDGDYGAELILLLTPQSQRSIFKASAKLVGSMFVTISDSHGTWFGNDRGIYLYTGTAFLKVSNQPGFPANGCF
jgi:hypothetical protein